MEALNGYDTMDQEAGEWAFHNITQVIGPLYDEIRASPLASDSELERLSQAMPDGPIDLCSTVMAGMDMTRGALDHIAAYLIISPWHPAPVFHPLLRAALVGTARVLTPLLPADPEVRLANARSVIWLDCDGFHRAAGDLSKFEQMTGVVPPEDIVAEAREQRAALARAGANIGDGALVQRMVQVMGEALADVLPDNGDETQREHAKWMWNFYSGAAHANGWPRLIPELYGDGQTISGNYLGDLFQLTRATQLSLYAVRDRIQPGTAGTTAPVNLQ
ncbi:MAG TPA: hypothetical protein VIP98_07500 [Microlunatus sp.]